VTPKDYHKDKRDGNSKHCQGQRRGLLRGRTDLNSQIDAEIQNAIRHYNRRVNWITERRGGTITTVAGTTWYSEVDLTTGAGIEDNPTGTAPTSTASVKDLLKIIYIKLEQGAIDWPLTRVSYDEFERLVEGNAVVGIPDYYTVYVGEIGLWPTPSAVFSLYISAFWKPTVPTADDHESVWFDEHLELIENSAARRVCFKWTHDKELGSVFALLEKEQEDLLLAEGAARTTTGRLKATIL
jgi:hypothetical protein